ncbi:MAG: HNH endonuclease [Myxococcales bacterium]|nr:HNH endonuclease [Myxococcales bacterium]
MREPSPEGLNAVDRRARLFPRSWKDFAIRILFDDDLGGVRCPGCCEVFRTRAELCSLQADHIVPWARGGETTWNNLQLLCGPCNLAKSS